MTLDQGLEDADLASSLIEALRKWKRLESSEDRQTFLSTTGLDRRLLKDLPYDAPWDQFVAIFSYDLVAALGTDPGYGRSLAGMLEAVPISRTDRSKIVVELERRSVLPDTDVGGSRDWMSRPQIECLAELKKRHETVDTAFLGVGVPSETSIDRLYVPLPTTVVLEVMVNDSGAIESVFRGAKEGGSSSTPAARHLPIPRLSQALEQVNTALRPGAGALPGEAVRPLILRPLGSEGTHVHVDSLYVDEAVAHYGRVLLVGGPGAGKTTAARHLAVEVAASCLNPEKAMSFPLTGRYPIFVSVSGLTRWDQFVYLAQDRNTDVVGQFIQSLWSDIHPRGGEVVRDIIESGTFLLIVDGLDEVWVAAGDEESNVDRRVLLARTLERFVGLHPRSLALMTCRPEAEAAYWTALSRHGFASVGLPPLRTEHAEMIAESFLAFSGATNRQEMIGRLRSLWAHGVQEVLSIPLYVALFSAAMASGDTTEGQPSRAWLLGRAVRLLAIRWSGSRSADDLYNVSGTFSDRPEAEQQLIEALSRIALKSLAEAHSGAEIEAGVDVGDVLRELTPFKAGMFDAFTYLIDESGLFEPSGHGRFRFRIRPFEEFLGALQLTEGSVKLDSLRGSMAAHPERWLEPVALACDLLAAKWGANASAGAISGVLLDWTLDAQGEAVWSFLWLASTAIERLVTEHDLDPESGTCLRLRDRIRDGFPADHTQSHYARFRVGSIISRLGDRRLGVGVSANGLPEFDWVALPAGEFEFGLSDELRLLMLGESWARAWITTYEQPSGHLKVSSFDISKFPVTVEQFKSFLSAPNGYSNEQWWANLGEGPGQRGQPILSQSESRRSDPATGVSWYDAMAFCRWASAGLQQMISLPTEPQWEYAARGSRHGSSLFPWGNEYDERRANGANSGLRRPSPVGLYWSGDGPWGQETPNDMSGNIWEWCTTIHSVENGREFRYPYDSSDGRETISTSDLYRRVVRGGSFTNVPFFLRSTMRGHDRPSLRVSRQGFRVTRVNSLPGVLEP